MASRTKERGEEVGSSVRELSQRHCRDVNQTMRSPELLIIREEYADGRDVYILQTRMKHTSKSIHNRVEY